MTKNPRELFNNNSLTNVASLWGVAFWLISNTTSRLSVIRIHMLHLLDKCINRNAHHA